MYLNVARQALLGQNLKYCCVVLLGQHLAIFYSCYIMYTVHCLLKIRLQLSVYSVLSVPTPLSNRGNKYDLNPSPPPKKKKKFIFDVLGC